MTRIEWDPKKLRAVEIRTNEQGFETRTELDPGTGIRLDPTIESSVIDEAHATAQRILDEFDTAADAQTKLAVIDEAIATLTMLRLARSVFLARARNDVETGEQP